MFKKYFLNWEFVLAVILFVGLIVISAAFVYYSYAWGYEYPMWLKYVLRFSGIVGSVYFPWFSFVWISDYCHEYRMEIIRMRYSDDDEFYDDFMED